MFQAARRARVVVTAGLLVAATAACQGAGQTVPVGFEADVASARRSLELHWDSTPAAPSFVFEAVRCRADGGLLVLFDQRGFAADGLAMAMRGPGVSGDDAWAGGFAPVDPATDPEIAHFFGEAPEVACS
jgi:hypothetical protein